MKPFNFSRAFRVAAAGLSVTAIAQFRMDRLSGGVMALRTSRVEPNGQDLTNVDQIEIL
jgi:hypothetical protein